MCNVDIEPAVIVAVQVAFEAELAVDAQVVIFDFILKNFLSEIRIDYLLYGSFVFYLTKLRLIVIYVLDFYSYWY